MPSVKSVVAGKSQNSQISKVCRQVTNKCQSVAIGMCQSVVEIKCRNRVVAESKCHMS